MSENSKIERWKRIPSLDGAYEISDLGNVRRMGGQLITGSVDRYRFVRLKTNGLWVKYYIHRLVADAFVPRKSGRPHVNHIDGGKLNNPATNLEWVSQRANNRHAYRTGLIQAGHRHHWSRLNPEAIDEIRRLRGIEKQADLAKRFAVSQSNISAIQLRKSWDTKRRCADVA